MRPLGSRSRQLGCPSSFAPWQLAQCCTYTAHPTASWEVSCCAGRAPAIDGRPAGTYVAFNQSEYPIAAPAAAIPTTASAARSVMRDGRVTDGAPQLIAEDSASASALADLRQFRPSRDSPGPCGPGPPSLLAVGGSANRPCQSRSPRPRRRPDSVQACSARAPKRGEAHRPRAFPGLVGRQFSQAFQ